MKETQITNFNFKELFNNSHRYGLAMGIILIAITIIFYLFDINKYNIGYSIVLFFLNMTVIVIGMVLATNKFRIKYMNRSINYGKCLLSAWTTAFVALLVAGVFAILFYRFFDTEYLSRQIEEFRAMMEGKISDEKLEKIIEGMSKELQPMEQLMNTLFASFIQSGIFALIVSIFIKKKDNTFESEFKNVV